MKQKNIRYIHWRIKAKKHWFL